MEIEFKMPDLATTDSTIKVIRWLVETGQPVTRGQPLLEVETDKATMEVECIATGRLKATYAQPGDELSVGQKLAAIESEGSAESRATPPAPVPPAAPPPVATPSPPPNPAGGMFAKNRDAAKRQAP